MPWTTPVNPVSGTVITVAYAVSNILDPIRWLRLLGGNADPPGSNYVLTSDSVAAVTWKQFGAAIVGVGGLGYTPANRAGDTLTGDLVVSRSGSGTPGAGVVYYGNNGGQTYLFYNGSAFELHGGRLQVFGDLQMTRTAAPTTGVIYFGLNSDNVFIFYNGTNLQANAPSGTLQINGQNVIHAGLVGNASGNVPISNGAVSTNLNAQLLQGLQPQNAAGQIPVSNNQINAGLVAEKLGSGASLFLPGNGNGNIPISNGNVNVNLVAASASNANTVAGKTPTTAPSAGALPLADAAGKLDAWVTPSGGTGAVIPPGLLCHWETATPPSGWVIDTRWDGMIIAMKGGPFSSTLGQTGGGSTHDHGLSVSHAGGGVSNGTSSAGKFNVSTPGPDAADAGHGHGFTPPSAHAISAPSQNHLPPYVSLNLIRKT